MSVRFTGGPGTAYRCYVYTSAPSGLYNLAAAGFALPSNGGAVDGVTGDGTCWFPAHPGAIVNVEAADAFAAGVTLATDGNGRARPAVAGEHGVLRALQASAGPGSVVACVFTHGNRV